ncbi:hypothetical protein BLA29_002343 [Euroglyphus maynei]|uniref:Uncharacterized protein n=1 Tax=Euroglyphus maynei TaxID=6958 RepID=A0A1Y3ANM6_EURMA|nr:hypothetical protein BLA29_002343 [Euroglyphus maynei]
MFLLDQKSENQQQKQQEEKQENCYCNYNHHHIPLFLTYNGYIDSDQDLMTLLQTIQKYEDFYIDWSNSFIRSTQLCRPSMFASNNRSSNTPQHSQQNIDIETKDYCRNNVEEFADSIRVSSIPHAMAVAPALTNFTALDPTR